MVVLTFIVELSEVIKFQSFSPFSKEPFLIKFVAVYAVYVIFIVTVAVAFLPALVATVHVIICVPTVFKLDV